MAKKIYAVKTGRTIGIFYSWDECKKQVDGFPNAAFKGFTTEKDALDFLHDEVKPLKPVHYDTKIKRLPNKAEEAAADDSFILYTDGSCLKNPGGHGGYAAVLLKNDKVLKEIYGANPHTTNNIMEMMAAIKGLELLQNPSVVKVYSDSQYLCSGFRDKWVTNWKRNHWKTSMGTPVKNASLWKALDALIQKHTVTFIWLKGHNGTIYNERCDELARNAAEKQLNG